MEELHNRKRLALDTSVDTADGFTLNIGGRKSGIFILFACEWLYALGLEEEEK